MGDDSGIPIDWDALSACGRWSLLHVLAPLSEGLSIEEVAQAYGHAPEWARQLVDALHDELKAQASSDAASA